MLLAGQGASAVVRAASISYTALAGGLSTGLEARHAMMTSLTPAGHSSGTLQDSKRRHEKAHSSESKWKLVSVVPEWAQLPHLWRLPRYNFPQHNTL